MNQNDLLVLQAIRRAKLTDIIAQENLEANRAGCFTEFQKTVLKTVVGGLKWRDFFIITGVVLLSAFSAGFIGGWALLLLVVLLIAAIFQIRKLHRQHLERIIAEGVQSAVGRYFFNFDKDAYEIDVSGEKGLNGIMVSAVPGAYKYYFVRKLKFVLSAEPCDPQLAPSFDPEKHSLGKVIKRAVAFKNDDLKANRAGMLSENQRNRIRKKEFIFPLSAILGFWFFVVVMILWQSSPSERLILIGLASVVILVPGLPLFVKSYKVYRGLKQGSVLSITGKGSKSHDEGSWFLLVADLAGNFLGPAGVLIDIARLFGGGSQRKKYYIGNQALWVSETAYMALGEENTYAAYYFPKTRKLLSIEQVQA